MEHVVFFPSPDGTPAFRRVGALEDAVRLVEHLRNVEGVHEVSVHALGGEVPLAFRTWYRVEVPAAEVAAPEASASTDVVPLPTEVPVEAPVAVVPEQATAIESAAAVEGVDAPVPALVGEGSGNGHVQDEAKSLGFFA